MGEIATEFAVSRPTICHHLKKLRVGLLASERRANEVFYRIRPERLGGVIGVLTGSGLPGGAAVPVGCDGSA
ncbi:ArsR/SmtB family transcription factor [Kitasatospora phosalacinea]